MHPPIEERYQETLDWIYSWVDFSMKRHVDDKHRFFKLDRMNQLMELLDFPHHKLGSTPPHIWRISVNALSSMEK